MPTQPSVIVLGLGIAGSSIAAALATRGHRVTGIEQFAPLHDRGSSHGDTRIFRRVPHEGPASTSIWQKPACAAGNPGTSSGADPTAMTSTCPPAASTPDQTTAPWSTPPKPSAANTTSPSSSSPAQPSTANTRPTASPPTGASSISQPAESSVPTPRAPSCIARPAPPEPRSSTTPRSSPSSPAPLPSASKPPLNPSPPTTSSSPPEAGSPSSCPNSISIYAPNAASWPGSSPHYRSHPNLPIFILDADGGWYGMPTPDGRLKLGHDKHFRQPVNPSCPSDPTQRRRRGAFSPSASAATSPASTPPQSR